jgi:hypothetical protein
MGHAVGHCVGMDHRILARDGSQPLGRPTQQHHDRHSDQHHDARRDDAQAEAASGRDAPFRGRVALLVFLLGHGTIHPPARNEGRSRRLTPAAACRLALE